MYKFAVELIEKSQNKKIFDTLKLTFEFLLLSVLTCISIITSLKILGFNIEVMKYISKFLTIFFN